MLSQGSSTTSMTASIQSHFEIKWLEIAIEHERTALDARDRSIAARDGSPEMGQAFDDELRAAAFSDVKRSGQIIETLKRALDAGKSTNSWQTAIRKLFSMRDTLVHFRSDAHETRPHPTGKADVSLENATFTVEAAT